MPDWGKKKFAPSLIAYYIFLVVTRVYQDGPKVFYELLWVCNVTMVLVIKEE